MDHLYLTDSYLLEFEAEVVATGKQGLALSRTAFYPESGGQPWDTGTLGGMRVVEVVEDAGTVWHRLEGVAPAVGAKVRGVVDRDRRLDHMRQHSGQHVLSEAFTRAANAPTVSFHLGAKSCTIDLDVPFLGASAIAKAEDLANEVVLADREVRVFFPKPEEIPGLRLRKAPPSVETVRIVDIGGFDVSACGGTHVARSGEIGPIKAVSTEKTKGRIRVEFLCGPRALADYRSRCDALAGMAALASARWEEVSDRFRQALEDSKAARKDLKGAKKRLFELKAPAWLAAAPCAGPARVLAKAFDGEDAGLLRETALALSRAGGAVVLFGTRSGDRAQLVFARSADAKAVDAAALLQSVASAAGGKGGGGPEFAQGGVPAGALEAVIRKAEEEAKGRLGGAVTPAPGV
jgi:alanyl-tRNA synthetase